MFELLLGGSVLLSLAFVAALGLPWRHHDRAMAWFLSSTGWAAITIDGALFVAVLGARLPQWVFALALGVQNAVFGWRLWLVVRDRVRWRRIRVEEE
ncbi:MAG TPA: hypothetical protein VF516_00245 [Kofleriaceae bacterium]